MKKPKAKPTTKKPRPFTMDDLKAAHAEELEKWPSNMPCGWCIDICVCGGCE